MKSFGWNLIEIMKSFGEMEREKAISKIQTNSFVFYGDKGGGYYRGKKRDFVLENSKNNFFDKIYSDVVEYFNKNNIAWWGGKEPTGHVLSSQIACLNHLFYLRNDKEAVKKLLSTISDNFDEVLKIETDKYYPAYIQFEAVSDGEYLNERKSKRGANCTSIDALIYAKAKDNSLWLIIIEWKYTEHYADKNLALEDCTKNPANCKGKVRRERYTKLICNSKQLKKDDFLFYFYEPFYQLTRQTLWAEQMILHKKDEKLKADNFLHIHIIPKGNKELLDKKYSFTGLNMQESWKTHLITPEKYFVLSPQEFLSGYQS